jgi:hypothetical protein
MIRNAGTGLRADYREAFPALSIIGFCWVFSVATQHRGSVGRFRKMSLIKTLHESVFESFVG